MGFFDSLSSGNSKGQTMKPSPVEEFFGPAVHAIVCRGSNLYVHEKVVVIDKTGGGLWNLGDNNVKIIPFKSIIAVQAKLEGSFIICYIEFETANSPLSTGSDSAERRSENSVILSGAQERYDQAREALKYIFARIV